MTQEDSKRNKRLKWLILLLLLITITAVGVAVFTLILGDPDRPLPPDYAPDTEQNSEEIPNDSDGKNEAEDGGGKVSLTYSNEVTVDLSDEAAKLLFANPKRSSHDVLLQIAVQDTVVAQSGVLKAGTQVKSLELLSEQAERLRPGGYHGSFLVFYYDQATGEQAMVNTEIPISIIVRN